MKTVLFLFSIFILKCFSDPRVYLIETDDKEDKEGKAREIEAGTDYGDDEPSPYGAKPKPYVQKTTTTPKKWTTTTTKWETTTTWKPKTTTTVEDKTNSVNLNIIFEGLEGEDKVCVE